MIMKIETICISVMLCHSAWAQTFTEKITREFVFEKPAEHNALVVANIHGGIKVTGYDGDRIVVEVTKTIKAKSDDRLEKGRREVQLGVMDRADTIVLYITEGCSEFRLTSRDGYSGRRGAWGYQSVHPQECNLPYDYQMEFVVKVPHAVNLVLNTINAGDVVVEQVNGSINAGNINGSIRLADLTNSVEAHTINGDVDIQYDTNPEQECRFYTLNGDINAMFRPALSAKLTFESFNGHFYTNITRLENLPQEVVKASRGDGLRYKITGNQFKIGQGGPLLEFETFNGNVYLKESIQ